MSTQIGPAANEMIQLYSWYDHRNHGSVYELHVWTGLRFECLGRLIPAGGESGLSKVLESFVDEVRRARE